MKNVFLLGLLSFFNDLTADMITPLLPAFLSAMGMGAAFLGIMEGTANSLSYITMLFSGRLADRSGKNKKITVLGYRLCAFLRPLIAIPLPAVTLAVRLIDRAGKGIRTPPRDNLLTASMDKKDWGRSFGIQRAMDHAGALIAPPLAVLLLSAYSLSLPTLFLVASVPALIAVMVIPRYIRERKTAVAGVRAPLNWNRMPPALRFYLPLVFLSGLSAPSELFLILKMHRMGLPSTSAPLAWFLLTFFALLSAYLGGILSDRWSRRRTIGAGWALCLLVYVGFAFNADLRWAWVLVALYGMHAGLIEAPERIYAALMVPPERRAGALGAYYFAYGLGLLPGSVLFGLIWDYGGDKPAFLASAALTGLTILLLFFLPSDRRLKEAA